MSITPLVNPSFSGAPMFDNVSPWQTAFGTSKFETTWSQTTISDSYWKFATLSADGVNTIAVDFTGGGVGLSSQYEFRTAFTSQDNGLSYVLQALGPLSNFLGVQVYQESDNSFSIYVYALSASVAAGGYHIRYWDASAESGASLILNPTPLGVGVLPTGTLVWDSATAIPTGQLIVGTLAALSPVNQSSVSSAVMLTLADSRVAGPTSTFLSAGKYNERTFFMPASSSGAIDIYNSSGSGMVKYAGSNVNVYPGITFTQQGYPTGRFVPPPSGRLASGLPGDFSANSGYQYVYVGNGSIQWTRTLVDQTAW